MDKWMEEQWMYKTYWGMEFNPFDKSIKESQYFKNEDYNQAMKRLEHLKNIKGIGLFTGLSGVGKTYTMKSFVHSLNPSLYKVIYLQLTTISVAEFYKSLATELGLVPSYKKLENYTQIQKRITSLYKEQKITLIILIDEAQYLHRSILADLKLLMNYEMDSRNYSLLILVGQPVLNNILSMQIHEALKQRIVINYNFQGISGVEIKEYISNRLKICGITHKIFDESAIESSIGCCNGSIRKLNHLLHKALMIGCEQKVETIGTEIMMEAHSEMELL